MVGNLILANKMKYEEKNRDDATLAQQQELLMNFKTTRPAQRQMLLTPFLKTTQINLYWLWHNSKLT